MGDWAAGPGYGEQPSCDESQLAGSVGGKGSSYLSHLDANQKAQYAEALGVQVAEEAELLNFVGTMLSTPMPEPWRECIDAQRRIYYFNTATRESSWTHPMYSAHCSLVAAFRRVAAAPERTSVARAELQALQSNLEAKLANWREVAAKDGGKAYFYHLETFDTRWDNPRDELSSELNFQAQMLSNLLQPVSGYGGVRLPACNDVSRLSGMSFFAPSEVNDPTPREATPDEGKPLPPLAEVVDDSSPERSSGRHRQSDRAARCHKQSPDSPGALSDSHASIASPSATASLANKARQMRKQKKAEAAATQKIQAVYRGHLGRRRAADKRLKAIEKAEKAKRKAEKAKRKEAEEIARREAEENALLEAKEKVRLEEESKREAEEKAQREAEEMARREAEEREAEEKTRLEAEQARREAEEEARKEAEEKARVEAEERARREAEEKTRIMFEENVRLEAIEQARKEAEQQARQEAEEKARVEAEEEVRREAEEETKKEAEEKARSEAEERTRRQAEELVRKEAEEQQRLDAEERARIEAEERAYREAAEKARLEAEEQARREAEEQAQREAEDKSRLEAEERTRREAEEKARTDAEEQARKELEEQAKKEALEQARLEAAAQAKRETEEMARQEAEEKNKRDAEEQARLESEEQASKDAQEKARREAEEQQIRLDMEVRAKREEDEAARQADEDKARLQAEDVARQEAEEKLRSVAEEQARNDADCADVADEEGGNDDSDEYEEDYEEEVFEDDDATSVASPLSPKSMKSRPSSDASFLVDTRSNSKCTLSPLASAVCSTALATVEADQEPTSCTAEEGLAAAPQTPEQKSPECHQGTGIAGSIEETPLSSLLDSAATEQASSVLELDHPCGLLMQRRLNFNGTKPLEDIVTEPPQDTAEEDEEIVVIDPFADYEQARVAVSSDATSPGDVQQDVQADDNPFAAFQQARVAVSQDACAAPPPPHPGRSSNEDADKPTVPVDVHKADALVLDPQAPEQIIELAPSPKNLVPAKVCACGLGFLPDAAFCRRCGRERPKVRAGTPPEKEDAGSKKASCKSDASADAAALRVEADAFIGALAGSKDAFDQLLEKSKPTSDKASAVKSPYGAFAGFAVGSGGAFESAPTSPSADAFNCGCCGSQLAQSSARFCWNCGEPCIKSTPAEAGSAGTGESPQHATVHRGMSATQDKKQQSKLPSTPPVAPITRRSPIRRIASPPRFQRPSPPEEPPQQHRRVPAARSASQTLAAELIVTEALTPGKVIGAAVEESAEVQAPETPEQSWMSRALAGLPGQGRQSHVQKTTNMQKDSAEREERPRAEARQESNIPDIQDQEPSSASTALPEQRQQRQQKTRGVTVGSERQADKKQPDSDSEGEDPDEEVWRKIAEEAKPPRPRGSLAVAMAAVEAQAADSDDESQNEQIPRKRKVKRKKQASASPPRPRGCSDETSPGPTKHRKAKVVESSPLRKAARDEHRSVNQHGREADVAVDKGYPAHVMHVSVVNKVTDIQAAARPWAAGPADTVHKLRQKAGPKAAEGMKKALRENDCGTRVLEAYSHLFTGKQPQNGRKMAKSNSAVSIPVVRVPSATVLPPVSGAANSGCNAFVEEELVGSKGAGNLGSMLPPISASQRHAAPQSCGPAYDGRMKARGRNHRSCPSLPRV